MFLETKSPGEAPAKTPSLEGFIEWLERQNPNQEYMWLDCFNCAAAQYAKSIGLTLVEESCDGSGFGYSSPLMSELSYIAMPGGNKNIGDRDTFGAALERARGLRP